MPHADVVSNGEQIRIWYDVYGLDATSRDADGGGDGLAEEPGSSDRRKGILESVLGTAIRCNCRPESRSVSSRAGAAAVEAQGHSALLREKDSGKSEGQEPSSDVRESVLPSPALGQAPAAPKATEVPAKTEEERTAEYPPVASPSAAHRATQSYGRAEDKFAERSTLRFSGQEEASLIGDLQGQQDGPYASSRRDSSEAGILACNRLMFIAGLGARGRTEFFQHVVEHMASLVDSRGQPMLSVCTFDSRGIGGSTIPTKKRRYTTRAMAYDTLALMDSLGWERVHIVGLSLGGMIGCKMAAMSPSRIASLTLIGTTPSGWHMLAGISTQPVMATLAGGGPLKWKIQANLRYNFSDQYLHEMVDGGRTRMQVLMANTYTAIEEKDTEKFLAEGQPTIGRKGHLAAVFRHRMLETEIQTIRDVRVPCLVLVGRHDRLARQHYVAQLARDLRCTYTVIEAGHAGIMIEALDTIVPLLESAVLGNAQTSAGHVRRLGLAANEEVLQNRLYAREFASSFAPGRVSFKSGRPGDTSSLGSEKPVPVPRSKSAV